MKKLISIFLVATMLISLASCSQSTEVTTTLETTTVPTTTTTEATITTTQETTEDPNMIHEYDELPVEWNEEIRVEYCNWRNEECSIWLVQDYGYASYLETMDYDSNNFALNHFLISNGYSDEFGFYDIFSYEISTGDYYNRQQYLEDGETVIWNWEHFQNNPYARAHSFEELEENYSIILEYGINGRPSLYIPIFDSAVLMNILRLYGITLGSYISFEYDDSSYEERGRILYDPEDESEIISDEEREEFVMWAMATGYDDRESMNDWRFSVTLRSYNYYTYCLSTGRPSLQGRPFTYSQEACDTYNELLEENGYVYRFGEQITWAQIGYQESIERGLNAEYNRELDQYSIDGVVQTYEDYCSNFFNEEAYANEIVIANECLENTVMYPHGPVVINEDRINEILED